MSDLVILESPSKAKTVKKYLGAGYDVVASTGHIIDLPKSKLGVDVEHNFEPQYVNMKDKADIICGSACEVLANGMFDYTKISDYLIGSAEPDVTGLLKESFDLYDKSSGVYRSSTVMIARTDGLDHVADVCSRLFEKYRTQISGIDTYSVQPYHRNSTGRRYFYDIVDIFRQCGAEETDILELSEALDACTVFKANTPEFMSEITFRTYSGVSMFLPNSGTPLLRQYYRKESWNKATGLLK